MTEADKKKPWLVLMHYRMRKVSFALVFVAIALHISGKDYSNATWITFALVFLLYPHLQYWRASKAENAVATEMQSLFFDSVLLGLSVAAIGYPLWITVAALLGTLTNNSVNKGWRGVAETLVALIISTVAGVVFFGFTFSPDTDWPTTIYCIVGLAAYLLTVNNLGFTRNVQLRLVRQNLQQHEKELLAVNANLMNKIQEIDRLQQKLIDQANHDSLTGLYNRRYLDSTLERELARSKREGKSLALLMIDIDYFKTVNDTYGHQAGDEMLIRLAALLSDTARAEDIVCRYGGEEFLLLLPTMSLEKAKSRAEELRYTFSAMVVTFGDFRLKATISVGVAAYPGHGASADELIRSADNALYKAKDSGRNCVVVAPVKNIKG